MALTPNLLLLNPPPGDPAQFNNWGTMENMGRTLVDSAVAGILDLAVTGGITVLTSNQNAPDQARNAHFNFTGTLTSNQTLLWPQGCGRMFSVSNGCTGAFSLILGADNGSGALAGSSVTVPQGLTVVCYSDGTNVFLRQTGFVGNGSASGNFQVGGNLSVAGTATVTGALGAGPVTANARTNAAGPKTMFTGLDDNVGGLSSLIIQGQITNNVNNTPTLILTSPARSALVQVAGNNTVAGFGFSDILNCTPNAVAVISSLTDFGVPPTRTYSISGFSLLLSVSGPNNVNVHCTQIGADVRN